MGPTRVEWRNGERKPSWTIYLSHWIEPHLKPVCVPHVAPVHTLFRILPASLQLGRGGGFRLPLALCPHYPLCPHSSLSRELVPLEGCKSPGFPHGLPWHQYNVEEDMYHYMGVEIQAPLVIWTQARKKVCFWSLSVFSDTTQAGRRGLLHFSLVKAGLGSHWQHWERGCRFFCGLWLKQDNYYLIIFFLARLTLFWLLAADTRHFLEFFVLTHGHC